MQTSKELKRVGRRQSKAIRIAFGTCLMTDLLALAGCSYLETVTTRTTPDDRVQLRWQDGALYLRRAELRDYTCENGRMLQCELQGVEYLCECPRY
jgi:hypothetical protein